MEIDCPETARRDTPVVNHHGYELVWCDCSGAMRCPQGKVGSQTRCRVWLPAGHLSRAGKRAVAKMKEFTR